MGGAIVKLMKAKNITSDRLLNLPPYFFSEFDRKREAVKAQIARNGGANLIDLSIGDPDILPSKQLRQSLIKALSNSRMHRYPPYKGTHSFCNAISSWYERKGIKIDPADEVWSLIGSKEGLVHLIMALVNPGEVVLLPNPCFPCYRSAVILAGGIPVDMPLVQGNNYLPELAAIKTAIARKTKLMLLNYPNNPTTADAPRAFYEEVVRFARKYQIVVCHDAAYQEIYFDKPPASFLVVKGAMEVGVEIQSFSKTLNIAGWRLGWAAGNKRIIEALGQLKTNTDSGVFMAIQHAVAEVLTNGIEQTKIDIQRTRNIYRRRRDLMISGLRSAGFMPTVPEATFYIWLSVPAKWPSSMEFSEFLLTKLHIHITPGIGFGKYGEGYVRISLTSPDEILTETIKRLKSIPL